MTGTHDPGDFPKIPTFCGVACEDLPLEDGVHLVCEHLQPIIDGSGTGMPLEIRRILVARNRSADVFVFVSGAGPKLLLIRDLAILPPVTRFDSHISCNNCWVDVYSSDSI